MDDLDAALRVRRDFIVAGASDLALEALASADALTHETLDPRTMDKISLAVRRFSQDLGLVGATDENVDLVVSNYDKVLPLAILMAEVCDDPFDSDVLVPELAQAIVATIARKELDPLRRAVDGALDLAIEALALPDIVRDEADHLVNEVLAPFVMEKLASGPFASVPIARIRWLVAELYLPEGFDLLPKIVRIGMTWTVKEG